jgi:putative ubiquitin-RnfH superfamily antitoxin RatB of RatAB toxin-antitoxin module
MTTVDKITVEIAYVNTDKQCLIELTVPNNFIVQDVIELSGILKKYPEIDLNHKNKIGIFGQLCDKTTIVKAGDRIEIYRPLHIDTMTRRFKNVKAARKASKQYVKK